MNLNENDTRQKNYSQRDRLTVGNPLSRRYDIRTVTTLGFGLVIAILLLTIIGNFRTASDNNDKLSQLVRSAELKTVLAHTMREAIRERVDSLRSMAKLTDIFERDAEKMRFFGHAAKYVDARGTLLRQLKTQRELEVIGRLDSAAAKVGAPNTRALNALFDDTYDAEAVEQAVRESIDGHLSLLRRLDSAVRTIHQTTQNEIYEAGQGIEQALLLESLLGVIALALAVITATLVVVNAGARNKQLSHQAAHDSLTGLLNRQAFEAALQLTLEQTQVTTEPHALLYLDLDRFKLVNDSCGHAAGDALLKNLSAVLGSALRSSDLLARIGGDEFGFLLRYTEAKDAEHVAEKIRVTVENFTFHYDCQAFKVGASIGMVPFGNEKIGLETLLSTADTCCYTAKEEGRNRVYTADHHSEQVLRRSGEMRWVSRITRAIENDGFVLFGQMIKPIKPTLDDGRLTLEVLLRMQDESDGIMLIPPGQFLPSAERYGIVPDIDRWVVRNSLEWLAGLGEQAANVRININICGPAASDPKFHAFIRDCLSDTRVPPTSVCFEITETIAIRSLANAAAMVDGLGDIGCEFALDDFGSGLSSFNQLRHLQIDYLKIDGSFIHNIERDPINRAMVESINTIGKKLGKRTVAEFVENERIHKILDELDVDYAQGFGLHRPEPLSSIKKQFLASRDQSDDQRLIVA